MYCRYLQYTLDHLDELVVKEVHGAGGYGMLVGPAASKAEIANFRQALLAKPEGYIAQPTLSLSSCPTYVEQGIAPRHIDLRPFVLRAPSQALHDIVRTPHFYFSQAVTTGREALVGFLIATGFGLLLGIAIGWHRAIYDGIYPVLVGFNSFAVAEGAGGAVHLVEVALGVLIGAYTFTGSVIAFLKLSARMSGAFG